MPGTLNIQLCPMISSAMYKHVLYANWTSVRRPINPSREDMRDLRMWLYDNGFPDEPCLSPFLLQPTPRWLNSSHLVQSLVPGIEFRTKPLCGRRFRVLGVSGVCEGIRLGHKEIS